MKCSQDSCKESSSTFRIGKQDQYVLQCRQICLFPATQTLSRCSSIRFPLNWGYKKMSCGCPRPSSQVCCSNILSDIACNNNEIKIIVTNPYNESVFSSVHNLQEQVSQATWQSARLRSLGIICCGICSLLVLLAIGFIFGSTVGWDTNLGVTLSSCLFVGGVLFFICSICLSIGIRLSNDRERVSHGQIVRNTTRNCPSPNTVRENSIIVCADKKISRSEFFNI